MNKLKTLMFSLKKGDKLIPKLKAFLVKEQDDICSGRVPRSAPVIRDAELSARTFRQRKEEYNHSDPVTADYFHPSQIGQCLRKLWFRQNGAPVSTYPTGDDYLRQHFTFEIGTYAHVLIQNLISRAGLLIRREVPIRNDKRKILGHADGILRLDGGKQLLEIKTINSRGFAKLDGPKPEHKMQTTVYMAELKLPTTIFVYYEKDAGQIKEYSYDCDPVQVDAMNKRIESFQTHTKKKTLPPAEGTSPHKFPCAWCEYSSVCFSTFDRRAFLKKIGASEI
jgi:CRISPR/Cas system-associated exonuclease Cas4 (RecB family)